MTMTDSNETGTPQPIRGRQYVLLIGVVLTIVAILALSAGASQIGSENPRHAARHMAVALPLLVLCISIARFFPTPKPTRIGGTGRRAVIWGLGLTSASLVMEAIGAFGYEGDSSRIGALTKMHNTAVILDLPGSLLLLLGLLLGLVSMMNPRDGSAST